MCSYQVVSLKCSYSISIFLTLAGETHAQSHALTSRKKHKAIIICLWTSNMIRERKWKTNHHDQSKTFQKSYHWLRTVICVRNMSIWAMLQLTMRLCWAAVQKLLIGHNIHRFQNLLSRSYTLIHNGSIFSSRVLSVIFQRFWMRKGKTSHVFPALFIRQSVRPTAFSPCKEAGIHLAKLT